MATDKRRRRARRIAFEAEAIITREFDRGRTPSQIRQALKIELDGKGIPVPELRTIQRRVQELQTPPSAPWNMADVRDQEEADVLVQVLEQLIWWSHGRITTITLRESDAILALARATGFTKGEYDAIALWELAREYVRRESDGADTGDLDAFVAFKPWTDLGEQRYQHALEYGWIARVWFAEVLEGKVRVLPAPKRPRRDA
jgi:hypothetical protein